MQLSLTYRSVVNDDIAGSHVAMENVLLQVLDEGALKRRRGAAWVQVPKVLQERHKPVIS